MREHHGMSNTPEYRTWVGMNRRCSDPKDVGFKHYGGRGIAVCDQWRESFLAFYADMGKRPAGMSLDRINVNGPYAPDNCRWATQKQQVSNRRNSAQTRYDAAGYTVTVIVRVSATQAEKMDELARALSGNRSDAVRAMIQNVAPSEILQTRSAEIRDYIATHAVQEVQQPALARPRRTT